MLNDTDDRPSSSRLSSASRRKHDEQNSHEISSTKSPNNDMSIDHIDEHSNDEEDHHQPQTDNQSVDPPIKQYTSCQFKPDKTWLDLEFHPHNDGETTEKAVKKPNELEDEIEDPPGSLDENHLDRVQGSMIGLALGDALGAHVEFRPYEYMQSNLVTDLVGGGTWGLDKGQFTDDTSMALCLANSLLSRKDFVPYDQMVRYKWWSKHGYMSSTGQCFDIGAATSQSIHEFEQRQKRFAEDHQIPVERLDYLSDIKILSEFNVYCSDEDAAGNGALMRLAPVPLFFFRTESIAVELSGISGQITHGDVKAYDACRFYGALIVAALHEYSKEQILAPNFYSKHKHWFGTRPLHDDIIRIAEGSYKRRRGHRDKIRGKGYIVDALEAALWAFWSNDKLFKDAKSPPTKLDDENAFERGVLAAINLGDDTDTTAAIYGQLAGAYYGFKKLPKRWVDQLYALNYMKKLSKWIVYEGEQWKKAHTS